MNVIKNKCDRGVVMGCSTSLMTAAANTAMALLFSVFWSQVKLKCNGTECWVVCWNGYFAFSWISTTWMYGLMETDASLTYNQHNNPPMFEYFFSLFIQYNPQLFLFPEVHWTLIIFPSRMQRLGSSVWHHLWALCPAAGRWPVWTPRHAVACGTFLCSV